MVLALAAAVLLGLWQLDVWQASRTAATVDLTHDRPVPLTRVMGGDSPFPGDAVGKPVTFSGRWLGSSTVYVSGRTHDGRRGYWVVTPVLVGRSAMPVVRGWSPRDRVAQPHGSVAVTGWLEPSEDQGTTDVNPHDPVITSMRIASLVEHVDADLYSGFVIARHAGAGTPGLAAVHPPPSEKVSAWTGLRNFLYGIQWWVFGGLAVYIWWRWCRDQLEARTEEGPSHGPERDPAAGLEDGAQDGADPAEVESRLSEPR